MLKILSWTIKLSLFAALVLVAGHLVRWDGRTLSDQVRIGMAHAERGETFHRARRWAKELQRDASKGLGNTFNKNESGPSHEPIANSERQRLRELISELNGAQQ